MAKDSLKKKQDEAAEVPLGTGMAEKTKVLIRNRQAELDARMAEALGQKPKKKQN